MGIFVALLALFGSSFEVHVQQRRLQVRRLVAVHAAGRTMRAEQRESRFRVIELR